MTAQQLLRESIAMECGMTRPLLKSVPGDDPGWTPHPKSMPLGRLAMHIATLPDLAIQCLTSRSFDFTRSPPPDRSDCTGQDLLATFDAASGKVLDLLAAANDAELSANWQLCAGERVLVENSRALILQHVFLGHLIHHRAQLGVYLRLLNLHVPGVYAHRPTTSRNIGAFRALPATLRALTEPPANCSRSAFPTSIRIWTSRVPRCSDVTRSPSTSRQSRTTSALS